MSRAVALSLVTLLLLGCEDPDKGVIFGYAEGRFRLLAPESEGRIADLTIEEGQDVAAGATIARLDDSIERARLAEAEARASAAASRFKDASLGGRDPEIQAARDLLAQAQATAQEAADSLGRVRPLFERGVVSRARLDTAEAVSRAADARVAELRQRLALVELPQRENVIKALEADAEAAQAAVAAAREALAKRTVHAPEAGRIERLLREVGESAGPSAPIVRYLPAGAMMAVGFIPEPQLGGFALGDRLAVACDSCADDLTAVVTSISQKAAFTSPTIFSDKERARLVFRLEARFVGAAPPSGTPLRLRALP
ncbi:MAG: biotin/lipoyl-binding protein [Kiloniellales bacterium]|nr:biotin/lipoyl-binding protein [Kiloniellales bacterium]